MAATPYKQHLKTESFKVLEGDVKFDVNHPYKFNLEFVSILKQEIVNKRLFLQGLEEFEQCALLRDLEKEVGDLVDVLKKSAQDVAP